MPPPRGSRGGGGPRDRQREGRGGHRQRDRDGRRDAFPPAPAKPAGPAVDRAARPPFLARVFVKVGRVPRDPAARRGRGEGPVPRLFSAAARCGGTKAAVWRVLEAAAPGGEVHMHTWMDASLQEVLRHALKTSPALEEDVHGYHFGVLSQSIARGAAGLQLRTFGYALPEAAASPPDSGEDKTSARLCDLGVNIGDYIVLAVEQYMPPDEEGWGEAGARSASPPPSRSAPRRSLSRSPQGSAAS
eukprot:TRINITY_DN26261_c0_g1_i1.p1 TRINITY_DN26261_c0_g1~~TRINITY_DN26261_c0_g1_i1.p1  ORF type:complete len:266 (+),score=46.59 TRINITY_DN26261_c0_g1_i1:65-799(+)